MWVSLSLSPILSFNFSLHHSYYILTLVVLTSYRRYLQYVVWLHHHHDSQQSISWVKTEWIRERINIRWCLSSLPFLPNPQPLNSKVWFKSIQPKDLKRFSSPSSFLFSGYKLTVYSNRKSGVNRFFSLCLNFQFSPLSFALFSLAVFLFPHNILFPSPSLLTYRV